MRIVLLVAVALLLSSACGDREERNNVRPPRAGTPSRPADVQGIYRSVHQGLLQLRADLSFVLIVADVKPWGGTYQLLDGRLSVRTDNCGDAIGDYTVEVTGEQQAGKATLHFTALRDECEERRRYLTIDPWIYADS